MFTIKDKDGKILTVYDVRFEPSGLNAGTRFLVHDLGYGWRWIDSYHTVPVEVAQ